MARSGQREQTGMMDREAPAHGLCLNPLSQTYAFAEHEPMFLCKILCACFMNSKKEPMKIPL